MGVKSFGVSRYNSKIAAEVLDFEPLKYMSESVAKRTDHYVQLGLAAAKMAIEDSRLNLKEEDKYMMGVCIGTGLGGILYHEEQMAEIIKAGPGRASP